MRRSVADYVPLRRALELLARMRVMPGLYVLVRVLDHDYRGVDHGADGDRNTAERHDVGVHALVVHDDEGDQHAKRQRDDGDESGAQMEEEQEADERDDDEFLDELLLEVGDGAPDQARAIVGRNDLHSGGQAGLQLLELRLDGTDRFQRVLARSHDDDAAGDLAFAVQLGNPAAHLRADLNARHVAEAH